MRVSCRVRRAVARPAAAAGRRRGPRRRAGRSGPAACAGARGSGAIGRASRISITGGDGQGEKRVAHARRSRRSVTPCIAARPARSRPRQAARPAGELGVQLVLADGHVEVEAAGLAARLAAGRGRAACGCCRAERRCRRPGRPSSASRNRRIVARSVIGLGRQFLGGRGQLLRGRGVLLRDLVELLDRQCSPALRRWPVPGSAPLIWLTSSDVRSMSGTRPSSIRPASSAALTVLPDRPADLARRGLAAFGQLAHLGGDHGEAAAMFARARRLDRRVQRQQVGLAGDLLHHHDPLGDGLHRLHGVGHGLCRWRGRPRPTSRPCPRSRTRFRRSA